MKAFVGFEKETILCMDLADVDKLAKDHRVVVFLPVPQGLFDRTPDAKGLKKKGFQRNCSSLL